MRPVILNRFPAPDIDNHAFATKLTLLKYIIVFCILYLRDCTLCQQSSHPCSVGNLQLCCMTVTAARDSANDKDIALIVFCIWYLRRLKSSRQT